MARFRRMDFADRQKIAELYGHGMTVADIAEQVGFNRASVYGELKRGFTGAMDSNGHAGYSAELAQRKLFERRRAQLAASE